MSNKDNFDNLFEKLQGQFDHEEPNNGHETRFLEKLQAQKDVKKGNGFNSTWKPFLAIAASILICLSVFSGLNNSNDVTDLASVSPELSEAQDFFTATITEELKKLDAERSPLTEHIIYEAERQLNTLEDDYIILKNELKQTGNDERIIYAMISNFQDRIDILKNILDKIEDLKHTEYETTNTL
ncbi:hypothetical protein [Winogradskyella haliclonae]|uniref:DUF4179 domain-containing protein n=1 Tax=Winogradskyella haliclonae TaxID=2048558 RepID=A0ABQ2C1V2_9FLAO|nr:hypothetical protein [Winogradskyella haliclonae]GGI57762.1 hypothetical protein GCM10011444_20710 [Winogradskyella haliclonae]